MLGPFPNQARARLAKEALEEAFAIRRCTRSMGRTTRFSACALADMGRCLAPCEGGPTRRPTRRLADALASAVRRPDAAPATSRRDASTTSPTAERFEEAALARDRLRVLADALWRARVDAWLTAGRPRRPRPRRTAGRPARRRGPSRHDDAGPIGWPPDRARADELAAVRAWIVRGTARAIAAATVAPSEPVAGGAALAALRARLARAQQAPDAPRTRAA